MAVPAAVPRHRSSNSRRHGDDDGSPPPGSYAAVRYYHKRAYDHLSKALEIDESGEGRCIMLLVREI